MEFIITYVGDIDGNSSVPLLRRVIDHVVIAELGQVPLRQHLGDGRGQSGLSVVHVTDCSNVTVRLVTLKHLLLTHHRTRTRMKIK